jgi:hypothetical protein
MMILLKILGLPAVLVYGLKILWQLGTLITRLCQLPKPDLICVQVGFIFVDLFIPFFPF